MLRVLVTPILFLFQVSTRFRELGCVNNHSTEAF